MGVLLLVSGKKPNNIPLNLKKKLACAHQTLKLIPNTSINFTFCVGVFFTLGFFFLVVFFLQKFLFLRGYFSGQVIDFNCMSARLGLFYKKRLENRVHYTFIITFSV